MDTGTATLKRVFDSALTELLFSAGWSVYGAGSDFHNIPSSKMFWMFSEVDTNFKITNIVLPDRARFHSRQCSLHFPRSLRRSMGQMYVLYSSQDSV